MHTTKRSRHRHFQSLKPGHILPYVVPPLILVLTGFVFFSSTGRDDSYITYWPAHTLSRFGEMLNYNGERVEQSSSLLHVLLLALAGKLSGVEIERLGPTLSILGGIGSLIAVYQLARKINAKTAFLAALLAATSAYCVYWSFGGMETTLVSLTAVILILAYAAHLNGGLARRASLTWSTGATILFALVRPETPIVLACMLTGTIVFIYLKEITSEPELRTQYQVYLNRVLSLLIISAAVVAGLFAFRILYFDRLLPQPVYAKSGGIPWSALGSGAFYIRQNLFSRIDHALVAVAVTLSAGCAAWDLAKAKAANLYLLLSLLFLAAYTAFILLSGGDWMEGGRFLAHLLPVAMSLVPFAMARLIRSRILLIVSAVTLLVVQITAIVALAASESTGMPLWSGIRYYEEWGMEYGASDYSWFDRANRVHIRDIPTIYHLNQIVEQLSQHQEGDVSIMTHQMGMVPYYIVKERPGQVQLVDIRGLTDRRLTDCPVASDVSRLSNGLQFTFDLYFENKQALLEECDIVEPDIIYAVISGDDIIGNGYTVVYLQSGSISGNAAWLPGRPTDAFAYIAVRNDLLPAIGEAGLVRLDFSDLQP